MSEIALPQSLQAQVEKEILDDAVANAKAKLLKSIKRSAYVYRVDCGGCNACEIEIFASIMPIFDAERFGIKVVPTPRQADIMVFTGAMTRMMRVPAMRAFQGAPDPKIVVSYGACGVSGGIFHDNYCVWGGTDKIFPVDVYIPGCPPSPAQTIYGFATALGLLEQKQKRTTHENTVAESAQINQAKIPYKLRVALQVKAREMSGYLHGKHIADQFMDLLAKTDGVDVFGDIDRAIAQLEDPRRAEVYNALRQVLKSMTIQ